MILTKEEAMKLHRELWSWLAENPTKTKAGWPGWEKHKNIRAHCFACEYTRLLGTDSCADCPLEWPDGTTCEESYFRDWKKATKPENRAKYAALIRDLPVKEEKKPEPKPKHKFQVGDKVKAITQTNGWGDVEKGDVGVITHTPETHPAGKALYRADFPNQMGWNGKECCFELVVEEPKPEPKFRVGDRVRVKEGTFKGEIGVVRDIDTEFHAVGVEFTRQIANSPRWDKNFPHKKGYGLYEHMYCLEPAPRNESPEKKTVKETITYHINGPVTVCIIETDHGKFKGVAKCALDDEFDEEYGKHLARVRAREKEDESLANL